VVLPPAHTKARITAVMADYQYADCLIIYEPK